MIKFKKIKHKKLILIYPIKNKTCKFGSCRIPNREVDTVKFLYGERWMHPAKKNEEYTTVIKNGRPFVIYRQL